MPSWTVFEVDAFKVNDVFQESLNALVHGTSRGYCRRSFGFLTRI